MGRLGVKWLMLIYRKQWTLRIGKSTLTMLGRVAGTVVASENCEQMF